MCGINGIVSGKHSESARNVMVQKMNARLAHRGPDHDGIWNSGDVTLGHRRLSIIDLSAEGNQPFFSADFRFTIVYNGELYNYRELKLELQRSQQGSTHLPYFFKTESDTEVILAAFLRWGSSCLERFVGMYAFAIYDTQTKKLFAARDRFGVKPFYYAYNDDGLIFSSELRAILHSGFRSFHLNREAIGEYAMYQTVHAPRTIVKEIKVLLPGHFLEAENNKVEMTQYYDLNRVRTDASELNYEQACSKVNELLGVSVQRRLVADVPFGAFLSGGIDSSIIVGLMSKVSTQKVRTFNVSFDEQEFSESRYAKLIAKRFNTEHHEIKLSPNDFLKDLPEAIAALDHPGGDGPNTYIVSKATKERGITMALSGVGGDELFAGYDVFKRMYTLQNRSWMNAVPRFARVGAGQVVKWKRRDVGAEKIAELLSQEKINLVSAYPLVRSLFSEKELSKLVKGDSALARVRQIISAVPQIEDHLLSSVSIAEMGSYLQNVLLRDADQMGMAVALEIREPYLDHQLVEFVLSLKDELKYPHRPKQLLVDSVGDLLPREIWDRPKMGFTLPWKQWMKNELKEFCESNLHELLLLGIFESKELEGMWSRFLNGDKNVTWSRLWHLIILNQWIREHKAQLHLEG
jgi:asparagine synthase (glutamine-hydrolysing)